MSSIELPPQQNFQPHFVNPTIQTSAGAVASQQLQSPSIQGNSNNTYLLNAISTLSQTVPKPDDLITAGGGKVDPNAVVNRQYLNPPGGQELQEKLIAMQSALQKQTDALNSLQQQSNALQTQINSLNIILGGTWNPFARIGLAAQIAALQQQAGAVNQAKAAMQKQVQASTDKMNQVMQDLKTQQQYQTATGTGAPPGLPQLDPPSGASPEQLVQLLAEISNKLQEAQNQTTKTSISSEQAQQKLALEIKKQKLEEQMKKIEEAQQKEKINGVPNVLNQVFPPSPAPLAPVVNIVQPVINPVVTVVQSIFKFFGF